MHVCSREGAFDACPIKVCSRVCVYEALWIELERRCLNVIIILFIRPE